MTANLAARRRRERAATKYRPKNIMLLLVAEAPPDELDRYFYFENVAGHDHLFREVVRSVLAEEPWRHKAAQLRTGVTLPSWNVMRSPARELRERFTRVTGPASNERAGVWGGPNRLTTASTRQRNSQRRSCSLSWDEEQQRRRALTPPPA